MSVSVILLCGGIGSRMKQKIPKQFLKIEDKIIAAYSFEVFENMAEIAEIIVVTEKMYEHYFSSTKKKITFARPGKERQDSVYNGLQIVSSTSSYVCVHDAARPFIDEEMVKKVIHAAFKAKAATLGMPIKFTIKEHDGNGYVVQTLDREKFWEIQTPQVVDKNLLEKGFQKIKDKNVPVTDDVSVVEILGVKAMLVEGSSFNFKITTPEDLVFASVLIKGRNYVSNPNLERST